jgi:hypothetical protein
LKNDTPTSAICHAIKSGLKTTKKKSNEAPSLLVVNCTKKFPMSPIDPNTTPAKKNRGDGCFYRRQRKAIKSVRIRLSS